MFAFIAYVSIGVLVSLCVLSPRFREKFIKLFTTLVLGSFAVALLIVGCCALQDAARAEDSEFYDVVAIITHVEEYHDYNVDTVVEVDDSDNFWEFYELSTEVKFDFNKQQNDIAVKFIVDNGILVETLRDYPLTEGRIVVMRMWSCGTPDVVDDEILGVYYTKFITVE